MGHSLREEIADARRILVGAGIPPDDAALDAEVLARHVLDCDRAALLTRGNQPAPPGFTERFRALITRRTGREPVAYIVGHREFWGLDFEVTRDVLIPRPETELIVDEALVLARRRKPRLVIDVGTGSGCIVIALAHELPRTRFIATDISEAALDVARRNASSHGVDMRIDFRCTDLLVGITESADVIVANPPYVPDRNTSALPSDVVQFEPPAALFAGADGLAVYRRLLDAARQTVADDGWLIVELGYDQQAAVTTLAAERSWRIEDVRHDLLGIPRVAVLKRLRTHG